MELLDLPEVIPDKALVFFVAVLNPETKKYGPLLPIYIRKQDIDTIGGFKG